VQVLDQSASFSGRDAALRSTRTLEGGEGVSVLRKVAIGLYAFGATLALALGLVSTSANLDNFVRHFGLLEFAYTFLPMLVLMIGVLRAQYLASHVVWSFVPVVVVAAGLLASMALHHGFPDREFQFAVAHLVVAVPVGVFILLRCRWLPPSNNALERERGR